jgi:ankyrin repeat protein
MIKLKLMRQTIKILLVTSLSIPVSCGGSDRMLFDAIRAKDASKVESILQSGRVELEPPQGPNEINKPLAFAAGHGNLEIVKLLLKHGADINGAVAYGDVPLIKAAEVGNNDIVAHLISAGADVNKPNNFGMTPFIGLCAAGELELVELALKHGGDPNANFVNVTSEGYGKKNVTALQAAVARNHRKVVELLMQNGGDPHVKGFNEEDAFETAKKAGHKDLLRWLEKVGKRSDRTGP